MYRQPAGGYMISGYPNQTPQVSLKNIEYLLISIQSSPERSQRWHLRRLHRYRFGTEDYHRGGFCNGYFTSKSYRDVLWTDVSPQNVEFFAWTGTRKKSKSAHMVLTRRGWNRANDARQKIGLAPLEWGTQEIPVPGACKIYQSGGII